MKHRESVQVSDSVTLSDFLMGALRCLCAYAPVVDILPRIEPTQALLAVEVAILELLHLLQSLHLPINCSMVLDESAL